MLLEMFAQCGRHDFTLANAVRAEEERLARKAASPGARTRSPAVAGSKAIKGVAEEDESSSDEDDDMGEEDAGGAEAGAGAGVGVGAKAVPDVDGWETVTSGKKKGRR